MSIEETKRSIMCNVTITADDGEAGDLCPALRRRPAACKDGDVMAKGDQLTEGALYPHEVLRIRGAVRRVTTT